MGQYGPSLILSNTIVLTCSAAPSTVSFTERPTQGVLATLISVCPGADNGTCGTPCILGSVPYEAGIRVYAASLHNLGPASVPWV
ncbi:hypothetical protein SKAU_G00179550 [Synaphobranchus kaupii]|uniref:Uncharacterized protein n=1 Tax=Synaphobranchus kaupii TaxID=118154 RepID=A0A9Q1FML0_SYNKA|nr:hypothetical protein SKAU_G00179550 [Synaphobranchus kaupii]